MYDVTYSIKYKPFVDIRLISFHSMTLVIIQSLIRSLDKGVIKVCTSRDQVSRFTNVVYSMDVTVFYKFTCVL